MNKPMLKNCWYVAALSSELEQELFERTIIGQSLLLYRGDDGQPVVMSNACPHRYAPLHKGKLLEGGIVECAYHGLQFNSQGECVYNPHGTGEIPKKACVQSYPLVEKHNLIWIWLGDPEKADEATIPDFSCLTDPDFPTVVGVIEMESNYELITDNLMDLTHVEYIHEGVLGSDAMCRGQHEILKEGTTVWSNRWCPDGKAPPAWAAEFDNYQDDVDLWMYMRWDAPAHMLLDVGITPKGGVRDEGIFIYGTDILTPKDETSTWYFWGISRSYGKDNIKGNEQWNNIIDVAFGQQDKPMIEAQQSMLKSLGVVDLDELSPVLLPSDSGPVRVRRLLNILRTKEADNMLPDPQNPSLKALRAAKKERENDRIVPIV